jgi:hypothetical protein
MKADKPKRHDARQDSDRKSVKLTVRLPAATAAKLERLAKARDVKRVTVLCDLIESAALKPRQP